MTDEELKQLSPLGYYKWHWQMFRANRRVQRMDYIARGLYRELLDEQWSDGSISSDVAELADICGCPVEVMQEKWPQMAGCFLEDGRGRLYNQTLEDQRTVKDAIRVKLAKNGGSGGSQKAFNAKLKLATSKQPLAPASNCKKEAHEPQASTENQSLSGNSLATASNCHIEEKSREEKSREITNAHRNDGDEREDASEVKKAARLKNLTAWAERCHAAYPRKIAKQDSLRTFIKHISKVGKERKISDDSAGAYMLGRVEAYRDSSLVANTPADKIPYPATWANAGHYEDEDAAWTVASAPRPSSKPFEPGINIRPSGDPSQAESDRAFIEFARSQRDKGVISAHDLAVLNGLENSNTAPN